MTRRHTHPEPMRRRIADAYAEGRTTTSLAREYGISASTVAEYVKEHGGTLRGHGRRPGPPEQIAYVGGWVRDGLILRPRVKRADGGAA